MAKKNTASPENFEQSITELEKIVSRMDAGDLSLEDALTLFERGVTLSRECQQILQKAQQKVSILVEKNGQLTTEPFEAEDE